MATTMTVKGQVAIPKKVRDALRLVPGDGVEYGVNNEGQVVVHKAGHGAVGKAHGAKGDRFTHFTDRGHPFHGIADTVSH